MKHSKGYNILPDVMDAVSDAKKGQLRTPNKTEKRSKRQQG